MGNIFINVEADPLDWRFTGKDNTIQISINELCKNQITTEVEDNNYDYLLIGRIPTYENIDLRSGIDTEMVMESIVKINKCIEFLESSILNLNKYLDNSRSL